MATQVRIARRSSVLLFEKYVAQKRHGSFMSHFCFLPCDQGGNWAPALLQKRALTHFAT